MTRHARLRLQDGRLRHWLNGVKTLEVDFFSDEFRGLVSENRFATMPDFARAPEIESIWPENRIVEAWEELVNFLEALREKHPEVAGSMTAEQKTQALRLQDRLQAISQKVKGPLSPSLPMFRRLGQLPPPVPEKVTSSPCR